MKSIQKQIYELQKKIQKKQERCKHPKKYLIVEYEGTGVLYDRGAESSWIEYTCKKCGLQWDKHI